MNDIMLEKLNNYNEKLKSEFEKEREKLHKETQKNLFNAHLQKDAEIKSIQKAIEKKQMNEENDSMDKSIHEYNELLKKMEKFAKDEKMRFTLANQKQVQNSKIKPKFNDVIVLTPENRPKLIYESEKMGKCDNCSQEYPLKRLTKSPKRT